MNDIGRLRNLLGGIVGGLKSAVVTPDGDHLNNFAEDSTGLQPLRIVTNARIDSLQVGKSKK